MTRIQMWAVKGGTVELSYMDDADGRTFWVDRRNAWGQLESADSFPSGQAAQLAALAIVDEDAQAAVSRNFEISPI